MTQNLDALKIMVLNADFTPHEIWDWRTAMISLVRGNTTALASYPNIVRSPAANFVVPSVLLRLHYVPTSRPAPLTRRNVFLAYANYGPGGPWWRCALCGRITQSSDLTFDHIVPRSKGGLSTWQNLALADSTCNNRKGSKTLAQAKMQLHVPCRTPTEREICQARVRMAVPVPPDSWRDFISTAYWESTLEA